jgi:flagellar protein FlbD
LGGGERRMEIPALFLILRKYVMIKVTRLDGMEYYINPHQIESIEINPDTTLVMLSGKHIIVRNEVDDVLAKIEAYHRRISPYIVQE